MVGAGAPEGPQVTWGQITIENHGVGPVDFQQVSLFIQRVACQVTESCIPRLDVAPCT